MPETILITAWYTPQIPVNQGPNEYWGLPGLILEVGFGKTILLCSKIVLNPKDKGSIAIPDKGKEVSQVEFDDIVDKKMKEMQDQFGGKNRKNGEINIKIGN